VRRDFPAVTDAQHSPGRCRNYGVSLNTTPTPAFAELSGAIEIARRVPDQTRHGATAVGSASEAIRHDLLGSLVHLENRSPPEPAASAGCAVEIVGRIAHQACKRLTSVGAAGKRVEHAQGLCLRRWNGRGAESRKRAALRIALSTNCACEIDLNIDTLLEVASCRRR